MGEWRDKFDKGLKKAIQDASMMDNAPSTVDFKQMLKNPENLKDASRWYANNCFFNTEKYPTASFMIKKVDSTTIYGTLTIKGISEEISSEGY